MIRSILAVSAFAFTPTAAGAASYSAKPSVPVSDRIVARDIIWNCGPDACEGATAESRPVVLCEGLAKRAGRIDSFLVDGRAIAPADLDRCNAAAKAQSAKALAAQ